MDVLLADHLADLLVYQLVEQTVVLKAVCLEIWTVALMAAPWVLPTAGSMECPLVESSAAQWESWLADSWALMKAARTVVYWENPLAGCWADSMALLMAASMERLSDATQAAPMAVQMVGMWADLKAHCLAGRSVLLATLTADRWAHWMVVRTAAWKACYLAEHRADGSVASMAAMTVTQWADLKAACSVMRTADRMAWMSGGSQVAQTAALMVEQMER